MDNAKLNALICLLDDPDQTIYNQVREEIIKIGPAAIHPLEEAWEHSHDVNFQKRIENLIHQIQFKSVKEKLTAWVNSPEQDVFEGALTIARLQYPDLDEKKINDQLEQIKRDVWLELNENLTALEKVKVINHILFDIHGFSGNVNDYHSPQNSFLNIVIESKKGNPLSLSIIYMIIAQRLGLPIYGVNLPEHFILCYLDTYKVSDLRKDFKKVPILFYINAFSKGIVFSRKDIDNFLKQLNIESRPHYYEPCTSLDIVKRILRNLSFAYEKSGQEHLKSEMLDLLEILEKHNTE